MARALLSIALVAGAASLVSGCMGRHALHLTEAPAARAVPQPSAPVIPTESRRLRDHYSGVQAAYLAQDRLRTDDGGPDAPYTAAMLARNFEKIALHEEYVSLGGRMVARETASTLHRWEDPVRLHVKFGGIIPESQRTKDRDAIERFVRRISRVSGHPVHVVSTDANFHVFIVDEASRRSLGPKLRGIVPSISPGAVAAVTEMPRSSYCLVFAWDPEEDGSFAGAIAVIRAEHPDLLRLSCIHEEIAQGMGLSNDSPAARPSIFNDDEEFGLLTSHDEELLRILYDSRLRPGMTSEEAMPIVRRLAEERMDGAS